MVGGTAADGQGLPFRAGRGGGNLCAQIANREPSAARPASGHSGRGEAGAAPEPPPPGSAVVTRPPSRAPIPSCPLPAPPAPGALTWKRFFTHSFFMAGEGAGRASGRGGDGRGRGGVGGGAGGDPGAGGSRLWWRKEPPGHWSPGRGKAAAPRACPSPARWHPSWLPFSCPAPLGQLSPASPHLHLASASRTLGTWGN